jgi:hypothetical protein
VAAYEQKSPTDWGEDIAALQAFGVDGTSTVVDLGAGTGAFPRAIAPHDQRPPNWSVRFSTARLASTPS